MFFFFFFLIPIITRRDRDHFRPDFIEEETEAEKFSNKPRAKELINMGAESVKTRIRALNHCAPQKAQAIHWESIGE